ncbi:MAG: carboxypeptidase-like regulatory domain-containing protein [Bacteroidia bacterium]|nr:carboxypeptidase-like regulatory domain-containing protein [Bacteroidia bacterium]MDW8347356.1 carboxypeptidase-like regulatory domain-containing protein [Bacteroidia bacterium]
MSNCQKTYAQSAIRGTVVEYETNEPIAGAKVYIPGTAFSSMTDNEGKYEIQDIPPGDYELVVTKQGYLDKKTPTQKVKKDVDIALNIQIEKKNTSGVAGN